MTGPVGPPPTIAAAVERYLAEAALAPRSIGTYRRGLHRFLAYLVTQGLESTTAPVTALSDDHLVSYAASAAPRGPRRSRSPARRTLQTYLAAVRGFYADLAARGDAPALADETLPARLRAVVGRPPSALPPRVHTRDLDRLIATVMSLPPEPRPARELRRRKLLALVLTLRCTGLRVAELCGLTRGAIDLAHGTVVVRPAGAAPSAGRTVRLDAAAVAALTAYWATRGDGAPPARSLPAFTGHDVVGQAVPAISPRTVQALIARLSHAAGLTTPVTPHSFRHGLALELVRGRVEEPAVQRLLGHTRAATTHRYVELVDTELERDM